MKQEIPVKDPEKRLGCVRYNSSSTPSVFVLISIVIFLHEVAFNQLPITIWGAVKYQ